MPTGKMSDNDLMQTEEWKFAVQLAAGLESGHRVPSDLLDSADEMEYAVAFERQYGIIVNLPEGPTLMLGDLVRLIIEIRQRPLRSADRGRG